MCVEASRRKFPERRAITRFRHVGRVRAGSHPCRVFSRHAIDSALFALIFATFRNLALRDHLFGSCARASCGGWQFAGWPDGPALREDGTMYAVVKTGGKQYRVANGDVITVEKLDGAEAGDVVELDNVLALDAGDGLAVGAPLIDGARVNATVLEQKKDGKIVVFKKKRRKNYRRTRGHRQLVTVLRIDDILGKGQQPVAAESAEEEEHVADTPAETVAADTEVPDSADEGSSAGDEDAAAADQAESGDSTGEADKD